MQVAALFAGKPQPFGPQGSPSSIHKIPIKKITVYKNGTYEDEQGNKKLHGGPEKVLHQFSFKSYRRLSNAYPHITDTLIPGSIGENILAENMDDTQVQIGDVYRIGGVIVQVSAPRAPCNKISFRYTEKDLDRYVGQNGITGWYYRVIEEGIIKINDAIHHLERPAESVSIHHLVKAIYGKETNKCDLLSYSNKKLIDTEWRNKCLRKLKQID